jgi:hypothetical protein
LFGDPESEPNDEEDANFEDSEESCAAAYKSFAALLRHMTQEKHIKVFQRYRVEDYAFMTYVWKLEEIDRSKSKVHLCIWEVPKNFSGYANGSEICEF